MAYTKVYVGNLSPNCDVNVLSSLFKKCGKIVECDIIRNFAFIHFADGKEAKLAVDMFNNLKWNGLKLKVELSSTKLRRKPGMGRVCYSCGTPGHLPKECPKRPNRNRHYLNNNNNNNTNSENKVQSSCENRGPFPNCKSSCDNKRAFLQSDSLDDHNVCQNDSFRDFYREPMSSTPSSSGEQTNSCSNHYERNNSTGNNYNDDSNNTENRSQSSHENRGPFTNGKSSRGNSGGFLESDLLDSSNGYRNDSFRDSCREPLLSSLSSYEQNYSSSNHYKNCGKNTNVKESGDLDRDISRNGDSCYDGDIPPLQRHIRHQPYPSASKRQGLLPSLSGNSKPLMQSQPSSASSLSDYQNNNNPANSHKNNDDINNNNNNSNICNFDPFVRPPPEYYERRRREQGGVVYVPNQWDDWQRTAHLQKKNVKWFLSFTFKETLKSFILFKKYKNLPSHSFCFNSKIIQNPIFLVVIWKEKGINF